MRLLLLTLAAVGTGAVQWTPVPAAHARNTAGSISRFLVRYWTDPLPPEGPPPRQYSALEGSLSPQSCAVCHRQQFQDWRTSLMSRSVGPGLIWQFRVISQVQANQCMRCHAPLAEQKALAALQFHWPNSPTSPPPAYIGRRMFNQGVVCAACHVRRQHRFGPPPPPGMPAGNTPGLPHGGFTVSSAFQHSRFCATCHQSPAWGRRLDGKPFENTYAEWRTSRFAREHITCQSCHMPGGRHLWRGIHDPKMVRRALRISLRVTRVDRTAADARAVIRSVDIGHDFPTYVTPKVYVTLYALGSGSRGREIARQIIGRSVNLRLTQEFFDTRIPPGASSVLTARLVLTSQSPARIQLRIEVSPGAHYEHLFRYELLHSEHYDKTTVAILRRALAQSIAARYQLLDLTVSVPSIIGSSRHAVAN